NIYVEVAEAGNPNPYREDARITAASIFTGRGRKIDALKQYEALANEAQKPALKAESAVRGGMIGLDLVQADKGKIDIAMADRAEALLRKGRALPEAGKFRANAQAGLRRLQYQTGQYAQLLAEYKKEQGNLPEAAQAEVLLLATSPTNERADQAKLLKAEALYKQQNCAEAVPIYEELRASQLSAKLRSEAAYKLSLCHAQAKNIPGIIEAFTYYMQTFPDD